MKDEKTCLYKLNEEPIVVKVSEVESYKSKGWVDTPAKLPKEPVDVVVDKRDEEIAKLKEEIADLKAKQTGEEDFEDLTVVELKTICEKRGISFNSKVTKAELIKLLG